MKYFTSVLILVLLTIFLLVALLLLPHGPAEGFANMDDPNVRAVKKVFGQIKNISGYLIDRNNWFYHMQLIGKSPVEMARMYLKSQRKSE